MGIEDIKLALTIYQVLDLYGVHYSMKGMQETILCPFHSEEKPSARIYPDVNKVHCYGACSRSFDVIDIVMAKEGLSLPAAVRFLEDRFSLESLKAGASTKFWQSIDSIKRKKEKSEIVGLIFSMGKDVVRDLRAKPLEAIVPLWMEYDRLLVAANQGELPDSDPIQEWHRKAREVLA